MASSRRFWALTSRAFVPTSILGDSPDVLTWKIALRHYKGASLMRPTSVKQIYKLHFTFNKLQFTIKKFQFTIYRLQFTINKLQITI